MTEDPLEKRKRQILKHEESMAHQLARRVIDKPAPSVWMILIPIFFVFHAWKIKEYATGLKDFVEHYLLSRRRALDSAYEAVEHNHEPDIEHLLKTDTAIPAGARTCYRAWLTLLVDHFRNLLTAGGNSVSELIRNHYRNKATYLLFNNQLNTAENDYNKALLPKIEGDQQDIRYVLDKMERAIADLHRQEAEEIFS